MYLRVPLRPSARVCTRRRSSRPSSRRWTSWLRLPRLHSGERNDPKSRLATMNWKLGNFTNIIIFSISRKSDFGVGSRKWKENDIFRIFFKIQKFIWFLYVNIFIFWLAFSFNSSIAKLYYLHYFTFGFIIWIFVTWYIKYYTIFKVL